MFIRSFTLAVAVSVLLTPLAFTPFGVSSVQASPSSQSQPKVSGPLSWMNLRWDEPDAPYTKIRRSIEHDLKKGVAPETLIRRYDNPQKWMDSKLTFGYLVASYERARRAKFSLQSMKALPNGHVINPSPLDRLQLANDEEVFPRNAEFARIAYLWWCNNQAYGHLYSIGKRLVARFPDDFDLKWWAFQSVMYGERKPNMQLLLKWADDLQRRRPKSPGIGILKPMVYYTTWGTTHSPVDEKKATDALRHFLAMAPPNDPQRKNAEFRLSLIPIRKQIWAKQVAKSR